MFQAASAPPTSFAREALHVNSPDSCEQRLIQCSGPPKLQQLRFTFIELRAHLEHTGAGLVIRELRIAEAENQYHGPSKRGMAPTYGGVWGLKGIEGLLGACGFRS